MLNKNKQREKPRWHYNALQDYISVVMHIFRPKSDFLDDSEIDNSSGDGESANNELDGLQ